MGRPVACYSDRYSVLRVNRKGGEDRATRSSCGLADAGHRVDLHRKPAGQGRRKSGRVARANPTLLDRLVKEMRLRGIGDMAAGNAYLPERLKQGPALD